MAGLDLWDCKPSGPAAANQLFSYEASTKGVVASKGGLCLTATVASGGGAEAMV